MSSVALVIPTYNAAGHLGRLLPAIADQSLKPEKIVVIDSSSRDGTAPVCREFGAEVLVIPQSEFDHGGTRQRGLELARPCDIAIFLTQDAIPAGRECFADIVAAFRRDDVGMAYGRQLPHADANAMAAHARLFNYPETGETVSMSDAARHGVRATFASDSFSAYRVAALDAVGGFPAPILFGEDMVVAARMLQAGWSKAYVAESRVFHSHNYSLKEEFRRYFDVGAVRSQYRSLLAPFGDVKGEGGRFVRSEIAYLGQHAPRLIPSAMLRTLVKFAGYRVGCLEKRFSSGMKRRLSMSPWFWKETAR